MISNVLKPLHVGISVSNMEASVEWYRKNLGFEKKQDDYAPPLKARVCFIEKDGFELELFQYDDPKPIPEERKTPNTDLQTIGTKHVAFLTDDMQALKAGFLENGVDIENILFENSVREYMHKDVYICRGGEESYTPSFVYHGFQYVYIEGLEDGQAQKDTLTYLVMHSDLKSAGAFSCSDEILNRLQENTRRSDLANFYYFPTDCPHREKNGWTGDAALSAEQLMLNFHAENSLREWLNNLRAAQKDSGELPGIVPTAGWGFQWGNGPAWDTVIVQLPYYIYKYTGDLTAVKENFPAVCRYLGYAKGKLNESGLLAYGLGDWCPVGDENLELTKLEITDTLTILDFCYKGSVLAELLREGGAAL